MAAVLTTRLRSLFLVSHLLPSSTSHIYNLSKRDRDMITRKLPLDVLYWMKTWWACSSSDLAVSVFFFCTVIAPSRPIEVTVGASDWASATPCRHTSKPLLLPRCNFAHIRQRGRTYLIFMKEELIQVYVTVLTTYAQSGK